LYAPAPFGVILGAEHPADFIRLRQVLLRRSLSGPRPDTPPPFEKGGRKLYLREGRNTKKFLKVPKTFFKKFLGGVWGNAPKTPRAAVKQDEKCSLRSFFGGWRRKKRTKKTPAGRRPHLFFWEALFRRPQIFLAQVQGIFQRWLKISVQGATPAHAREAIGNVRSRGSAPTRKLL
jgi:hypothetical protein